jgi:hypothetical protein
MANLYHEGHEGYTKDFLPELSRRSRQHLSLWGGNSLLPGVSSSLRIEATALCASALSKRSFEGAIFALASVQSKEAARKQPL